MVKNKLYLVVFLFLPLALILPMGLLPIKTTVSAINIMKKTHVPSNGDQWMNGHLVVHNASLKQALLMT